SGLSFLGPQLGWRALARITAAHTSSGIAFGCWRSAREWGFKPSRPSAWVRHHFVARLPTDAEAAAQLSHAALVLEPLHHKGQTLLHGRDFLPGHGPSSGPHGRCHPCPRSSLSPMCSVCTRALVVNVEKNCHQVSPCSSRA